MAKRRKRGKTVNVNYEYYRLFYYVCKYHSITRAANVLRMSQPNVTRALNRLEEQLGCKLLVRSTRGVTMTPEGEVLFAHVEIAQEQLQAGESELAGITALESGALTISASETALNVFCWISCGNSIGVTQACGCALPTIPPRRPSVRWGAGWWIFV